MWTSRRVHSFLNLITMHLAAMDDSASLRDALEASIFFSTSMGRLGADFTAQIAPIFEKRMHDIVVRPWKEGVQHFTETLRVCRDVGVVAPLVASKNTDEGSFDESPTEAMHEPQPPPRHLMCYPPLARLVNAILTGLNELRRCLLPGICQQLRQSLNQVIEEVRTELQNNDKLVNAPSYRGQASDLRQAAGDYRNLFDQLITPYLLGSLEAAIGNQKSTIHYHTMLRQNLKKEESNIQESKSLEEEEEGALLEETASGTAEGGALGSDHSQDDDVEDSVKSD